MGSNPARKWAAAINEITSVIAVVVFEYYAVAYYIKFSAQSWPFVINQILALNFLVALYYSTKTLRAAILNRTENRTDKL